MNRRIILLIVIIALVFSVAPAQSPVHAQAKPGPLTRDGSEIPGIRWWCIPLYAIPIYGIATLAIRQCRH